MAYNTQDDIAAEIPADVLIQLTDDQNLGVADDTVIARVLARASAEVDGYCSSLYDVPLDPVTAFIRGLDLDIAVYHLFSRRENVPENRLTRYNNAVKVLKLIAGGDIQLGASGPGSPQQSGQNIAIAPAAEEIFTMKRLKNY
jgi:phage gp36-like protein